MTRRLWAATAVMAALLAAGKAHAQGTVSVGDPAPKLDVKEFVKGQPVTAFEKGKLYVVEFWATWCGPCKVSIPHLTELQKKHKDVAFVGVSVWETDQAKVKPFVEQMGDKMDYRIAMDIVPEGGEGVMAKTWMTAAGQNGIPAAFIINGDGKIAWIGHPMTMEKPLEQIVKGEWDIAKAAADFKVAIEAKRAEQAKAAALREKLTAIQKRLDAAKAESGMMGMVKEIDAVLAEDPSLEPNLAFRKFMALSGPDGDVAKAVEYGNYLMEKPFKDNGSSLYSLASTLVNARRPQPADPKLLPLAVAAATKADAMFAGKQPVVITVLARALFLNGQPDKAVEAQERAIKLAEGTDFGKAQEAQLKDALAEYKKAAQKP